MCIQFARSHERPALLPVEPTVALNPERNLVDIETVPPVELALLLGDESSYPFLRVLQCAMQTFLTHEQVDGRVALLFRIVEVVSGQPVQHVSVWFVLIVWLWGHDLVGLGLNEHIESGAEENISLPGIFLKY